MNYQIKIDWLFYDAIMQRQFLGIEPNLKGVSKLAYVSKTQHRCTGGKNY